MVSVLSKMLQKKKKTVRTLCTANSCNQIEVDIELVSQLTANTGVNRASLLCRCKTNTEIKKNRNFKERMVRCLELKLNAIFHHIFYQILNL
jgi:hypothetical protein